MAKPTDFPRWADNGGDIVEPASGKKDIGHVAGEHPPAQYENWWKNTAYGWFVHLDGLTTRRILLSPAAAQFTAGALTSDGEAWDANSGSDVLVWGIPLTAGERITAAGVWLTPGGAPNTPTVTLSSMALASSPANTDHATDDADGTGTYQLVEMTGLSIDVVDETVYRLSVVTDTGADLVYGAYVDIEIP